MGIDIYVKRNNAIHNFNSQERIQQVRTIKTLIYIQHGIVVKSNLWKCFHKLINKYFCKTWINCISRT